MTSPVFVSGNRMVKTIWWLKSLKSWYSKKILNTYKLSFTYTVLLKVSFVKALIQWYAANKIHQKQFDANARRYSSATLLNKMIKLSMSQNAAPSGSIYFITKSIEPFLYSLCLGNYRIYSIRRPGALTFSKRGAFI